MKITDFSLLFNEKDFPIKWQKEYLRLLTTFEVRNTIYDLIFKKRHSPKNNSEPLIAHHPSFCT